jgi:hypothetical protein
MKKLGSFLGLLLTLIAFCSATVPKGLHPAHKKNSGCGYTVIEFGVGVNCNGDTVKLVRSKGFQRLASRAIE